MTDSPEKDGASPPSPPPRRPSAVALAALTVVTAIWGWSFLLVKEAVAVYPVFAFLAVRFTLAACILVPFLLLRLRAFSRGAVAGGLLMGAALFSGYAFQTLGLLTTSAAHSGFITGLFVVLTPLFQVALTRRLPRPGSLLAVFLAFLGLALLSWPQDGGAFNRGDLLSLCCAAAYAVHLLLTSHMARRHDTALLTLVQVATVALLSGAFALFTAPAPWPIPSPALRGILLTALLATALAYYVQTTFQRYTTAIQTAIVFTLEPVFAGLFAVLLGGETLGTRGVSGGALIVAAMFVGQASEAREAAPAAP
ncbi:MAG: DMT family transporter [Acidobacteriota bacterium]